MEEWEDRMTRWKCQRGGRHEWEKVKGDGVIKCGDN